MNDEILFLERDISILDAAISAVKLTKDSSYETADGTEEANSKQDVVDFMWKVKFAMERKQRTINQVGA